MPTMDLLNRLIYLDRDFISGAYEAITGHAPVTQITKNEGMKAGAQIPFFSAGISSAETRSFSVSTLGMLKELLPELDVMGPIGYPPISFGKPSKTGWIEGNLSIFKVIVKSEGKTHEQFSANSNFVAPYNPVVAFETYFAIHSPTGVKLALITTSDYFSSGLDALTKLYETVLEETTIPVRALVRVYSSQSTFDEWISTPLIVLEQE